MTLRRANWPDVDDVVALSADAEVMRYFDDSVPMTASRVLAEEMPRLMADNLRSDQLGFWVARDCSSGDFLGWFMVSPVEDSACTVRLGYRLRRRAWGQGLDVEGILQMITMARAADMSTVVATTLATNLGSRWVLEEAGLQPVLERVASTTGPVPVIEHGEVVYILDLSEAATLPA